MPARFPPPLKRGDTIGVFAPSSAAEDKAVEAGVEYLTSRGYRVKEGANLTTSRGFLADRDEVRAAEFNRLYKDRDVRALFAVRGGYGAIRLLEHIDYDPIRAEPKIIMGYSDVTALQMAVLARCDLVSYSGPMVAIDMHREAALRGGMPKFTEEHMWSMLSGSALSGPFPTPADQKLVSFREGSADGPLFCGTLSVLLPLLGTSYMPSLDGAMLVLEDLDEKPGRLDRAFQHLRLAGVFDRIGGLVLGQFPGCFPDRIDPLESLDSLLSVALDGYDFPVLTNFAYGHVATRLTLPVGGKVSVTTNPPSVSIVG